MYPAESNYEAQVQSAAIAYGNVLLRVGHKNRLKTTRPANQMAQP
jgi:hypothetical protein